MASAHFTTAELSCEHCGQNICPQKTYDMLEQFRGHLGGKPVIVDSGYRCPEHNKAVGGAPSSQHLLGNAADIRVAGMSAAELEAVARQCSLVNGIGRSDHAGFLHIDCRENPAEWCYDASGQQCPYFPILEKSPTNT